MLETVLWTLFIFFGRIIDVALGTLRITFIVRKQKIIAAVIGFIEVTIFVTVIARVITDISEHFYGILAYGGGFAVGTIIGLIISEKLSKDLISTNIISKKLGPDIENELRNQGFGVTCQTGYGREGDVRILNVICRKNFVSKVNKIIFKIDPECFMTSHTLETGRGGYFLGLKKK